MRFSRLSLWALSLTLLLQSPSFALVQTSEAQNDKITNKTSGSIGISNQKPIHRPEIIKIGKEGTILDLFTQTGQVVTGDNDQIYFGTEGTVVGNTLYDHQLYVGCFLIDTGKLIDSISTRLGKVTIAPESTVLIYAPAKGPTYIVVAGGTDQSAVSFTPIDRKNATSIKAGEMLTINNKPFTTDEIKSAEIIPQQDTDNILKAPTDLDQPWQHKPGLWALSVLMTSNKQTEASINILKTSIDLNQLWQQEPALWMHSVLTESNKGYSRLVSHINLAAKKNQPDFDIRQTGSSIPMIQPIQKATKLYATANTVFMQYTPGVIVLARGGFLLYNLSDTLVATSVGEVHSAKDSLVAIEYKSGNMRVKACSGIGKVHIKVADSTIPLNVGTEILVINHHPTAVEAAPYDGISRRGLRISQIDYSHTIVTGDFSLVSMLQNARYMQSLRNDQAKDAQRLLERIIKAASVINTVEANSGRYFMYDGKTPNIPDGLFIGAAP